jgi:hypothetical protein
LRLTRRFSTHSKEQATAYRRGRSVAATGIQMVSTHPAKRIGWGIVCAVLGILLHLGIPVLLMNNLGLRPTWYGGGMGAIAYVPFLAAGFVAAGLSGLIAGIVRPGGQSLFLTLKCLLVIDICMLPLSVQMYAAAAVVKVVLAALVAQLLGESKRARPPQS